MNFNFILVQLIGLLAWLTLIYSYHKENTNQILLIQIISTILYCLHYYLLQADSALFICVLALIIDYSYYKTELDKYIFYISIPIYLLIGVFYYHKIIDILPTISSLIDSYTLTKNKKIIIIGAIISYTTWFIYDLNVSSYICAITDILVVLSNLFIFIFNKPISNKTKILSQKAKI